MPTDFDEHNKTVIDAMRQDKDLQHVTREWFDAASRHEYSYHFTWLGRPIIQFPQDIVALQEIIWSVQPRVIVETGIARGGSLIFYASMLELLGRDGLVVGVDIDIRPHNRTEIQHHPMMKRIRLIEGSSIDPAIVLRVREIVGDRSPVLVMLDSNHTHDHVYKELLAYSPLVTKGSYLVAFDTVIELLPERFFADRPWSRGDNAMTAVKAFLQETHRFEVDRAIQDKLLITVAPDGYLRCVKD